MRVLFQPHLYSRTRHLAGELAAALAAADDVAVTDVYPAREEPVPGVTGKLVVDALSDRGVLAAWTPTVEQGRATRRRARAGDVLLVLGAGDVDRRRLGLLSARDRGGASPSRATRRSAPAGRRAGSRGRGRSTSSRRCSAGRATRGVAVETIGLGSNLLVHDDGVDALVLRLAGELAAARVEGDLLVAGGGAANAVCLHRARAAGLGGFEFASAIPGTAGGGVRMNAGAYGSDWRAVLVDAVVVDADGRAHGRRSAELGLSYRHSGLAPGEVVAAGALPARAEAARRDQGDGRRAARAAEGDPADEQADVRQRLQEPEPGARRGQARSRSAG